MPKFGDDPHQNYDEIVPWFAWYPVKLSNRHWTWLRSIYRQRQIKFNFNINNFRYQIIWQYFSSIEEARSQFEFEDLEG